MGARDLPSEALHPYGGSFLRRDERCREFAQAKGRVISAKVVRMEHHDPTEAPELKVDIDIVFVQLVIEQNGVANLRGAPLSFIRVGDGFKFVSKP